MARICAAGRHAHAHKRFRRVTPDPKQEVLQCRRKERGLINKARRGSKRCPRRLFRPACFDAPPCRPPLPPGRGPRIRGLHLAAGGGAGDGRGEYGAPSPTLPLPAAGGPSQLVTRMRVAWPRWPARRCLQPHMDWCRPPSAVAAGDSGRRGCFARGACFGDEFRGGCCDSGGAEVFAQASPRGGRRCW